MLGYTPVGTASQMLQNYGLDKFADTTRAQDREDENNLTREAKADIANSGRNKRALEHEQMRQSLLNAPYGFAKATMKSVEQGAH